MIQELENNAVFSTEYRNTAPQEGDFAAAVRTAAKAARPGEIVLLSPASASFDLFKNFEERGERFKELVRSL